jgi:type IV pilus assembly protein PilE
MPADRPGRRRGFSLIEWMVVVAAIAILASIAVPNYQRYGYRARRVEAKELLMRVAHAQERYHATYHRYAVDMVADLQFASDRTERGSYRIELSALESVQAHAQGYRAVAHPENEQVADQCGPLSISHQGRREPSRADPERNANGICW